MLIPDSNEHRAPAVRREAARGSVPAARGEQDKRGGEAMGRGGGQGRRGVRQVLDAVRGRALR